MPYGIPITVVDSDHEKVEVEFQHAGESDAGPYPLGDDTKIAGGRRSDGNKHAIIVDLSTFDLYETWFFEGTAEKRWPSRLIEELKIHPDQRIRGS